MAVVTTYTAGYPSPNTFPPYYGKPSEAVGTVRGAFFNIAVNNGDSIGSIYKLGRLPSKAIVLPLSTLYVAAGGIAGLTNVNVGLNYLYSSTKVANALASAANFSAAGTYPLTSNILAANYGQRVWQLLGLPNDPGGDVDIEATLASAATGAGQFTGWLFYTDDGPS